MKTTAAIGRPVLAVIILLRCGVAAAFCHPSACFIAASGTTYCQGAGHSVSVAPSIVKGTCPTYLYRRGPSEYFLAPRGRDDDGSDEQQRQNRLDSGSDISMASADVPSLARRRKRRQGNRQHPSRQKRLDDNQRKKQQRQRRGSRSGGASSGSGSKSQFISQDLDDFNVNDANDDTSDTWEIDDLDSVLDSALQVDEAFEHSIDSYLDGEYSQPFADDAPAPHPGLTPSDTLDCALRSLRKMDEPYESHGAAVFMKFCAPLSRGERWGGGSDNDPWKSVCR